MESVTGLFTISKALSHGSVSRASLAQHCLAARLVARRLQLACDSYSSSLRRRTPVQFAASSPCLGSLREVPPRRRMAFSVSFSSSGGGVGGFGGESGGGGGGGGSGSDGGDAKSKLAATGGEEVSAVGSDVIVLDVRGMTCGGCAASVKRILESQPQVSSASVNLTTETAVVWPVAEAKEVPNWHSELGEVLAKQLTNCGFSSNLRGEAVSEGDLSP